MCQILDDDYNVVINEDKFFNLYTYNEYIKDIYKTNRAVHFENVLKTAKFSLCSRKNETNEVLNKEMKKEMTEISKDAKEKLFNDFIESEDKTIKKFENIENRMTFLNLPNDKAILEKYKDVLICDHNLEKHINVIRVLKSDDYITKKLNKIDGETFKVKTVETVYNKIQIVRNF